MRTWIAAFLALGAASATPARAGAAAPPSPAALAERVSAAFPAPGPKAAFAIDVEVRSAEGPLGTGRFEAVADARDGKPAWKATETLSLGVDDSKTEQSTTAWLAPDLSLLDLQRKTTKGREYDQVWARRGEKGLAVRRERRYFREPMLSDVEAPPSTTGTMSGLLLFLRQCPADPAVYERPVYRSDQNEVAAARIEVLGPGRFGEGDAARDAWRASVQIAEDTLTFWLAPGDRALLSIAKEGGKGIRFLPAAAGPARAQDGLGYDPAKPAASALEAAGRFALARLTGDAALASSVLHWESLAKEASAGGEPVDLEGLKKTVLARLTADAQALPAGEAERRVREALAGATVKSSEAGIEVVRFGPPLESLSIEVQHIGEGWFVARLPK